MAAEPRNQKRKFSIAARNQENWKFFRKKVQKQTGKTSNNQKKGIKYKIYYY